MNSHSSKLLAISVVVVLGVAMFAMRGGSGHDNGILANMTGVSVASAAGIDSPASANVAGDKGWEVIGGPVKVSAAKAVAETAPTPSAPMSRTPW